MKNCKNVLTLIAAVMFTGVMLSACGSGPSTPSRFYVLSSPTELLMPKPATSESPGLLIGVGPVALPPHLDRTQIVTQASRHRLDLKELDQWAEPLKDGFTRVLAQNLATVLKTDQVYLYPWRRPISIQYQITVSVLRFDTDAAGVSVLTARWAVVRGDGRELLFSHISTFKSRAEGDGMEPTVAAMSRNLAELSREIGASVAALTR